LGGRPSLSRRWQTVRSVSDRRPGLQEVELADGARALNFVDLTGRVVAGAQVLVNTTALELGLGSGGWHIVIAQAAEEHRQEEEGHLLKLRYLPHQVKVFGPEDPRHPDHGRLLAADGLDGLPVVCLGLHSQLAPAVAACRTVHPDCRAVYVMTDEASLPAALSDVAAALRGAELLQAVISAGLHSALIIAKRLLEADVVFVGIGPGNLGSGTALGHGGVAQGEAVNAVAALGGTAVAALRLCAVDPRERHRGVSHHSRTALGRIALGSALVPVPERLSAGVAEALAHMLAEEPGMRRHAVVRVPEVDWQPLLRAHGIVPTSMGRGVEDDPDFFAAAAAAGTLGALACRRAGGDEGRARHGGP
jgi:hypothetical protein